MSVLSNPQGTPERVWSLVAGLASLGGSASRADYDDLLNPGYRKGDTQIRANYALAANAHGAASSLKLVEANREHAKLLIEPLPDFAAFADCVHHHLINLSTGDPDSPILEAFAWLVAESDRSNEIEWIYRSDSKEFADHANSALVGDAEEGKLMNPTKLVAWRRWLAFLGLGIAMPLERTYDFPLPIERIVREMSCGGSAGTVMRADEFVNRIASRMPYLDRGRLYTQACQRISHTPAAGRVSPLLSAALRNLHDEGTITLGVSGDAAERVRLSADNAHAIDAFTSVTLFPAAAP